jgi:hypothetical protein
MACAIALLFDVTENASSQKIVEPAQQLITHRYGGHGQADLGSPAQRIPERLLDLEASATLHILRRRLTHLRGVLTQTCPDALQDRHRLVF